MRNANKIYKLFDDVILIQLWKFWILEVPADGRDKNPVSVSLCFK
jgi:hypothetical protein